MELAALIIAFCGAMAAAGSAIMAWTARADSLKAQEEAHRSATRATVATEQMTKMQASIFNSPPWTFEWWSGDTYLLTNTSSVDALEVVISASPEQVTLNIGFEPMPGTIGARSAVKIMYGSLMSDPWVKDIVVAWKREGGDEQLTWKYPIPAKPKGR